MNPVTKSRVDFLNSFTKDEFSLLSYMNTLAPLAKQEQLRQSTYVLKIFMEGIGAPAALNSMMQSILIGENLDFIEGLVKQIMEEKEEIINFMMRITGITDREKFKKLASTDKIREIVSEQSIYENMTNLLNSGKVESLFDPIMLEYLSTLDYASVLLNTTFVNSVTIFENAIAGVFDYIFDIDKNSFVGNEMISLADFLNIGNIDDFIYEKYEQKRDELMRQSLTVWRDIILEKTGVDMVKCSINWDDLRETMQRRHIIIHNKGRISSQYKKALSRTPYEEEEVGREKSISKDYLSKSIDNIVGTINALVYLIEQKKFPKETEVRSHGTSSAMTLGLYRSRWDVVEHLSKGCESDKNLTESQRITYKLNRLLSVKRKSGLSNITTEIHGMDHKALSSRFSCVLYALSESKDDFFASVSASGLTKTELKTWPILDEMREDERFSQLLHSIDEEPSTLN